MKTKENKIAIIIPFFGKWPAWFDYFLCSCSYNTSVDWLFFTDCDIPVVNDKNIKFVEFSLNDFNNLASSKLDLQIEILHPYKICDLRPAFGVIFSDYIKNYDFWGYGDIDLIYGDLDAYFIEELLNNYDILSNHHRFMTGHLCIIRNKPKTVYLYKKDGVYKDVFKDPFYMGFDEQLSKRKINPDGVYLQSRGLTHLRRHILINSIYSFLSRVIPVWLKPILRKKEKLVPRDFTSIVQHYAGNEGIRTLFHRTFQSDLMLKKKGIRKWCITWEKGCLTSSHNQEKILYFHFILSKLDKSFFIQDFINGIDQFTISNSGITSKST